MADERALHGLEALVEAVATKEAEVIVLKTAANAYASAFGLEQPFAGVEQPGSTTRRDVIRADLFAKHGAPSAATRAYLEWRGEAKGAATIDEIYDALHRGGFSFEHRNADEAKSGLRIALSKDAQIAKLANGHYGLGVWYGQTGKKTKGGKEARKINGDEHASSPPAQVQTGEVAAEQE